ncbi:hypothetical protein GIB67_023102 [Kingdonia uniflora]|uniref:Uncharacterized protein n=1 Tax=Kingdonia uniflora TaxID=39325 RepID=A0A7J7M5J5_9MAGN|nr:hypothetical protein GIB67_023102 [Kingdonia uniflora]
MTAEKKYTLIVTHPYLLQCSELSHMALNIAMKGVSSHKAFAFAKGLLTKAEEELDNFLKINCDEEEDLEDSIIDKEGEENKVVLPCFFNINIQSLFTKV